MTKEEYELRIRFAIAALPWALEQDYGNDWGPRGARAIPLVAAKCFLIADAMLIESVRHD